MAGKEKNSGNLPLNFTAIRFRFFVLGFLVMCTFIGMLRQIFT